MADKESVQNHAAQLIIAVHEMADDLDSGVAIDARRAEMVRSLGDLPAALERLFTHRAAMDLVTTPPVGQMAPEPEPEPVDPKVITSASLFEQKPPAADIEHTTQPNDDAARRSAFPRRTISE